MKKLVLHAQTVAFVERMYAQPTQSLMLVAPEGAGKQAVAEHLALKLLAASTLDNNAYYRLVGPEKDKTSVAIEAMRTLQEFGKLKALSSRPVQRIAVIDQAHMMTHEAQNAALKLFEEPPQGMMIVLLAANEQAMLPTIRSRVQAVHIGTPLSSDVAAHYIQQGHPEADVTEAMKLSGGLPGLTFALLTNAKHPLTNAVDQARELLKAKPVSRLAFVDSVGKSREDAVRLCIMLGRMASVAIKAAAAKQSLPAIKQWHRIMKAAYQAEIALRQNAQPKLVLTNLVLQL